MMPTQLDLDTASPGLRTHHRSLGRDDGDAHGPLVEGRRSLLRSLPYVDGGGNRLLATTSQRWRCTRAIS